MNVYLRIADAQRVEGHEPPIWLASGKAFFRGKVVVEHFGTHAGGSTAAAAQADCRRRLIEMVHEKDFMVPLDDVVRAEYDEPGHDDMRGWIVVGRLVKNGNVLFEHTVAAPSAKDATYLASNELEHWALIRGHVVVWPASE